MHLIKLNQLAIMPIVSITQTEVDRLLKARSKEDIETNINSNTREKLSAFCQANKVCMIMRPVNPMAQILMQRREAVGKSMFVHGKSSIDSIINGLIPVNASLSKAGIVDTDKDKIKAFQEENFYSLKNAEDKITILQQKIANINTTAIQPQNILKTALIAEEEFDEIIDKTTIQTGDGKDIYIFVDKDNIAQKDLHGHHIYAIKEDGKYYRINNDHQKTEQLNLDDYTPQQVEVIVKPTYSINDGKILIKKLQPITADIDVLAYGLLSNEESKRQNYVTKIQDAKEKMLKKKYPQILHKRNKILQISADDFMKEKFIFLGNKNELYKDLKGIENQHEQLKGQGDATDDIFAITGAMRAEFPNSEISHASEQLNYDFTQSLDQEWVLVDHEGKFTTIKGEDELIKKFNDIIKTQVDARLQIDQTNPADTREHTQLMNIIPNPNWGWCYNHDKGEYEINNNLVTLNERINKLTFKDKSEEENQLYEKIHSKRKEMGLFAISRDENKQNKTTTLESYKEELNSLLDKYDKTAVQQKQHGIFKQILTSIRKRFNNTATKHYSSSKEENELDKKIAEKQKIDQQHTNVLKSIRKKLLPHTTPAETSKLNPAPENMSRYEKFFNKNHKPPYKP